MMKDTRFFLTSENVFLLQLQEVLEKSDTMMAVVKDLFGDDPRVSLILETRNASLLYLSYFYGMKFSSYFLISLI